MIRSPVPRLAGGAGDGTPEGVGLVDGSLRDCRGKEGRPGRPCCGVFGVGALIAPLRSRPRDRSRSVVSLHTEAETGYPP